MMKIVRVLLIVILMTGCSRGWSEWNRAEKGAVIGGAGGAVLGGAVGSQVGAGGAGALIGGAAGAGSGALIGNELDKDREEARRRNRGR